MKPTPSKVALLMSAAGLGLAGPGVALAVRDANARPDFAVTFGVPTRSEQSCLTQGFGVLAPCQFPADRYLQVGVAGTKSMPLPTNLQRWTEVEWSYRAFDASRTDAVLRPHAAHVGHDSRPNKTLFVAARTTGERVAPVLGRPNHAAPLPDVQVATQIDIDADPVRVAEAIAMISMEDPQEALRAAPATSELTSHAASALQPIAAPAVTGEIDVDPQAHAGQADGGTSLAPDADSTASESSGWSVDSPAALAPAAIEVANVATAAPVAPRLISAQASNAAAAEPRGALPASGVEADDRGAGVAQFSASEDLTSSSSDPTSLDRVLGSLADVLSSQVEGSSSAFEPSAKQAATPKLDVRVHAPVASKSLHPAPVRTAPPIEDVGSSSNGLSRVAKASEIVVASHADKVLLSLAALRSGEVSDSGRFGAQTKETVVVRHADKVLETLALFQPKRSKRGVAGIRPFANMEPEVTPTGFSESCTVGDLEGDSVTSALVPDSGSLPDVSPLAADSVRMPVAQTPARPALPDLPAADRMRHSAIGSDLVALSSDRLEEVRGGFVAENGLNVSFGIERAVYLNGSLVTTTSLNVADLSKLSAGQAQVTTAGPGSLALIQSGPGNTYLPGAISPSAMGTVIQNTLDNQKIQTVTRIDAVVNSVGIMRSINLQSSMRSAVIQSLQR